MAYRIYTSGNNFYILDETTDVLNEGLAKDVLVRRGKTSSTAFSFDNVNGIPRTLAIEFADIKDVDGNPYADIATFINYYENNTGFSTALGGSGAKYLADNYTDLLTKDTTYLSSGDLAYVKSSQGTKWLPGGLGGDYYAEGWYLWNGSAWISDRVDIANALQDLNDDKLNNTTDTLTGDFTATGDITANNGTFNTIAAILRLALSGDAGMQIESDKITLFEDLHQTGGRSIGTVGTPFVNGYFTTLYGDGSNLTGINGKNYTDYVANLTQTSTNAPVATVGETGLGGTLVWSRTATGTYRGVLAGAFTGTVISFFGGNRGGAFTEELQFEKIDNDTVEFRTYTGNILTDGVLLDTSLEIRVY